MDLDWGTIRTVGGSLAKGFEEFCAQIARSERPEDSKFIRKGSPDAGVECYAILPDSSEWAWQVKYYLNSGEVRWDSIDGSVEKALTSHPAIVKYYVCLPLDRPEGRKEGRKSLMDRWNEHEEKWQTSARVKGMSVEFIYWGESELIASLSNPKNIGKTLFWFDSRYFDKAWIDARLKDALRSAEPRYSPEIHVDLPIAVDLAEFSRSKDLFKRLRELHHDLEEELWKVKHYQFPDGEGGIRAQLQKLIDDTEDIIREIRSIEYEPSEDLGLVPIVERCNTVITGIRLLSKNLFSRESEVLHVKHVERKKIPPNHEMKFKNLSWLLSILSSRMKGTKETLEEANRKAGSDTLLLVGDAGTGKTHILCDTLERQVEGNAPAILLMGHRFLSSEEPWEQALQLLDLPRTSAEEFIGALEAAAQVANCRALFMVDALNEGNGREIWPAHLPAFLSQLEQSPWIGVVLSVRSSFESEIISEEVAMRSFRIIHYGFSGHQFEAAVTFFSHYNIELPSAPIFLPEFRNPLFLKTLCAGLQAQDQHRLPRGRQGISAIFAFFIQAINKKLAREIDYHPSDNLVDKSMELVISEMIAVDETWLSVERSQELVNSVLPGRPFSRSIYRAMIDEGLLMEETSTVEGHNGRFVIVGYERLRDYLIAKKLVDIHLDLEAPQSAFTTEGGLHFISDVENYIHPGLLEALFTIIPEKCSQELSTLSPSVFKRVEAEFQFRRSLLWRDQDSISEETIATFNLLIRDETSMKDSLDVLVMLAAVPEHKLNGRYLDSWLRGESMAERDSWWSIYLHHSWNSQSGIDQLLSWAMSIGKEDDLDPETVNLCSTTIAWLFTSSNRFLRDYSTKALVNLLTNRFDATVELLERFAEIDDLYVLERVLAVCAGVVLRSSDKDGVGKLAEIVYLKIFSEGSPPAHILVRDYARQVVERAVFLECSQEFDSEKYRPPYLSEWPEIPTKEECQGFIDDVPLVPYDTGRAGWSKIQIIGSVMDDDFARYIIGTNSSNSNWLPIRLSEPMWKSRDERISSLVKDISREAGASWIRFVETDKEYDRFVNPDIFEILEWSKESESPEKKKEHEEERERLAIIRKSDLQHLRDQLDDIQREELDSILKLPTYSVGINRPESFDLEIIQRFILMRVFSLGWTVEKFGDFDRHAIGYDMRSAGKAERIGKKYQWIAYHEILAFVSDHYQYRSDDTSHDTTGAFPGPWNESLRDIDPSNLIRATVGGTGHGGHRTSWWAEASFENWGEDLDLTDWVGNTLGHPSVDQLLSVVRPFDGTKWLNLHGTFRWQLKSPDPEGGKRDQYRELAYWCKAYLIKNEDLEEFLSWAGQVEIGEFGMPGFPDDYEIFLGEHGWSPASNDVETPYHGEPGWSKPGIETNVRVRGMGFDYVRESGTIDCSIDENYRLSLPSSHLIRTMGLIWNGEGASYSDQNGGLCCIDPSVVEVGPNSLLIRQEFLREYLDRLDLSVCWIVQGEKRVFGSGGRPGAYASSRISGVFTLEEERPTGTLKQTVDG